MSNKKDLPLEVVIGWLQIMNLIFVVGITVIVALGLIFL